MPDMPFSSIISTYLSLPGSSQRALADEFEAAVSSISRWATGISQPTPAMQRLVVAWIFKQDQWVNK